MEEWALIRRPVTDADPRRHVARQLGLVGRGSIGRWPRSGLRSMSASRVATSNLGDVDVTDHGRQIVCEGEVAAFAAFEDRAYFAGQPP